MSPLLLPAAMNTEVSYQALLNKPFLSEAYSITEVFSFESFRRKGFPLSLPQATIPEWGEEDI